jgi:hypothetical protein
VQFNPFKSQYTDKYGKVILQYTPDIQQWLIDVKMIVFPGSGWDGGHVRQLQQFYLYLLLAELTQATIFNKNKCGFLDTEKSSSESYR